MLTIFLGSSIIKNIIKQLVQNVNLLIETGYLNLLMMVIKNIKIQPRSALIAFLSTRFMR